MAAKVSMFRGEPRHVWVRRLEQRGWPSAVAADMATFLTEKGAPLPAWDDLVGRPQARSETPARPEALTSRSLRAPR